MIGVDPKLQWNLSRPIQWEGALLSGRFPRYHRQPHVTQFRAWFLALRGRTPLVVLTGFLRWVG